LVSLIQILNLRTNHTRYAQRDIINDVKQLLGNKPDTKHLTITIDYINSPKVYELLQTFEKEILEGRLNFVLFRSGQKFDMLGVDNYYGAPYYIINNNGAQ
jgi:hypothetical protein